MTRARNVPGTLKRWTRILLFCNRELSSFSSGEIGRAGKNIGEVDDCVEKSGGVSPGKTLCTGVTSSFEPAEKLYLN